ncbi:MAG TPA: MarR family transcriptional regulator [Clostridiales bacterium]|nr:MarR family transcriptional regulator [Clostridiales bacterium]
MLEDSFLEVYNKFKLEFYRSVFALVREREGSLSAMEAFSLEIIRELGEPTVGRFAESLHISQSNATYKVASLIRKGYLMKENSDEDRREYHLILSDKYYGYIGLMQNYIATVMARIRTRFSAPDVEKFSEMLSIISSELMPEANESL